VSVVSGVGLKSIPADRGLRIMPKRDIPIRVFFMILALGLRVDLYVCGHINIESVIF
jgi:hypothetical protein